MKFIYQAGIGKLRSFPGGITEGTDSHTPNAGGVWYQVAIGVGGADAAGDE